MRKALPISEAVGRRWSMESANTSSSIFASKSSGSLKPLAAKNLMPLSWKGLCEAEMTTPASARRLRVRNAMPGVGIGPTSSTSTPIEQMPEAMAVSSM